VIQNIPMKKNSSATAHLPIIIEQDEDNMYVITCPTFKGCHSQGKDVEEALTNIKEVISMCMDELNVKQFKHRNRFIGFRELEVPLKKLA
jgi:predicted RNase H-like HicB family nuclease